MKAVRDWPALMKPLTARAYLDNMPATKFGAGGASPRRPNHRWRAAVHRKSLDDWTDASGGAREVQAPEALGRLLDDDDGSYLRHQALRE